MLEPEILEGPERGMPVSEDKSWLLCGPLQL